jgi:hypothetical protein
MQSANAIWAAEVRRQDLVAEGISQQRIHGAVVRVATKDHLMRPLQIAARYTKPQLTSLATIAFGGNLHREGRQTV